MPGHCGRNRKSHCSERTPRLRGPGIDRARLLENLVIHYAIARHMGHGVPDSGGEVDGSEEISRGFVIARGDGTELF